MPRGDAWREGEGEGGTKAVKRAIHLVSINDMNLIQHVNMIIHQCTHRVASFPVSTPQLFSHKSWGVQTGNEPTGLDQTARSPIVVLKHVSDIQVVQEL